MFILWLDGVLNDAISDVFQRTPCPCSTQECAENDSGYKIGIALIQQMEIDYGVYGLDNLSGLVLHSCQIEQLSPNFFFVIFIMLYLYSNHGYLNMQPLVHFGFQHRALNNRKNIK